MIKQAGVVLSLSLALLATLLAGGCTIRSTREAPVVDRSRGSSAAKPATPSPASSSSAAAPEAEEGSYVVKAGDTLYSIALAHGQDYRDIARWSALEDPTKLRIGQVLRVKPPVSAADVASADAPAGVSVVPVAPVGEATTRPLDAVPSTPTPLPPAALPPSVPANAPTPAAPAVPATPTTPTPPLTLPAPPAPNTLAWVWPVNGKVIEQFHESRNKGIDIAAKEGDPVLAASDGTVVYSGNGLRGYGNLVIIKHSEDYISAYAHNKQIVVKQGQVVKRGQRIANVGRSDAEQAKLHFEVRRQGKPMDPLQVLPAR